MGNVLGLGPCRSESGVLEQKVLPDLLRSVEVGGKLAVAVGRM
jgi:hypothetical protein